MPGSTAAAAEGGSTVVAMAAADGSIIEATTEVDGSTTEVTMGVDGSTTEATMAAVGQMRARAADGPIGAVVAVGSIGAGEYPIESGMRYRFCAFSEQPNDDRARCKVRGSKRLDAHRRIAADRTIIRHVAEENP